MDARRSGSAGATTSDDVNGKDGTVEATRPVGSAYGRKVSSRYGRRPTPWPGVNPDPQSMNRMLRRHTAANATQSSEEGDVFEPLPAPRKCFSRQAHRKAPRNAEPVRVAAPKPSPQEHPSDPTSRLDVRPDSEMMASLAAQVESDVTQFSGDDDTVPPIPPRSPLRLTFAPGTNTQARPSNKKKKGRFDSLRPETGHYVPGGRKLSSDVSGSPGPVGSASDGSENVSDSSHGSARSNPGLRVLNMVRQLTSGTGTTAKRPSVVSLGPDSQARASDGGWPTTGTDQANAGQAALDVLNVYRGDPARRPSRRSITAIPKVSNDLGVLPETYANDGGWPGPSRSRRKRTRAIEEVEELEEEEELDDGERSPTDTRAPQLPLPETLPSSQPDVASQGLALSTW